MPNITFIPGKTKARPEAMTFKFKSFFHLPKLPQPPKTFGHEGVIGKKDWGMLGNDNAGDCVWAGAAHETMLWNKGCGIDVPFNDTCVLSDYSAVTGFNPNDPNSDQGTDMVVAASYRRKTGILDANGKRHPILAYLALTPGDWEEARLAAWVFHAVGLGIEFPASAMDQFNKGRIWSYVKGSPNEGGHYIPMVAKRRSIETVSWGQEQGMSLGFFGHYNDEGVAYMSEELLGSKKLTDENFDRDGLIKALNQLKTQ